MLRSLIAASVLVAALPFTAAAKPVPKKSSAPARVAVRSAGNDILPFHPTEKTLPNGLKVIVVPTG